MYKLEIFFFRETQNNDSIKTISKSILIAIFGCMTITSYSQLNIFTINKEDKWKEVEINQRRLYVSAISDAESIVSVKNRMMADDFKNMMISEQRDSSILWVYFKTDSSLAIANMIEQLFLGHGIESCQDATLYGFQNNQMTDTSVYQDKRLRYFKLLPLKTVNKEPKEWLLKLIVPPYSSSWRSAVYVYIERKSSAEGKDYNYLIYQIPLIALIIILIFSAIFSLFQCVYGFMLSHIVYAIYLMSFLPYLYIKIFNSMGGYYIPYWNILYNIGEPLSAILVNIFYFGFVMTLLDMKKYHQKWYNYFFRVIIINVLFLVIHCTVFFFPFNLFKSFDVYGYFRIYQFLTSLLILYFLRWQQPQYLFWGSLSVIFFSSITILTHIWAHFDEDIEIYIKAADTLFYLGILIEVFCFSISIGYRIFTLKQEKIRYEESFNMFKSDLHTSIVNGLNNLTWDLDDKFNNEFDKEKTLKKAKDLLMKSKDLLNADTLKNKTIEDILKFDYKIEDLEVKKIKIDFDIDEETAASINAKSNTVKQHIYLIYSEVINNIIKYAKCQHISVHLGFEKKGTLKYMKLIVADDGIGFDKTLKTGNGLGLIEWHAQQLNGSIEISSEIKKGTKVCLLFTATRPTLNKFKK